MTIQLLVSVRSAAEAEAAVAGGADIIDVKDPSRGALGLAAPDTIRDILETVNGRAPVSVACGEIREWTPEASRRSLPDADISKLAFAKLGPVADPNADWSQAWMDARRATGIDKPTKWVAVAYGDANRSQSPSPQDILSAAIAQACSVFLIDTGIKDGSCCFDFLSVSELKQLRETAHAAGLTFALAGQLREHHLQQIREVAPDICGVRGAVCEDNDRSAVLSEDLVRAFRINLQNAQPQIVSG